MKHSTANGTFVNPRREPAFFYGWMIVGTSFILAALSMGVQGSFGNFIKPISAEFGWSRATATLPFVVATLMSGIFQPMPPLGRPLCRVRTRYYAAASIYIAWNNWHFTSTASSLPSL